MCICIKRHDCSLVLSVPFLQIMWSNQTWVLYTGLLLELSFSKTGVVEFTTSYTIPVQTDGIFYFIWLLLVACAITHHSYVQSTVLEPCSRLVVQINDTIDPLRWSVDTTASTSDVVCRLFGTTITTVARGQFRAQHVYPKSTNTSP